MARGHKKHLKRLHAPKHWMLGKMDGIWAPRPSTGPHKLRECLPMIIVLRNRLKYALNGQEVKMICMQKLVKVDGKTRTDHRFPVGFMDVVRMDKSGDTFRLLYDVKGRFVLHRISEEEAQFKLCRVNRMELTKGKTPYIATHDGRTIRYPDPLIRVNDTVRVNINTNEIEDFLKFEIGQTVMVTKGKNTGRVGELVHVEHHPGSFDIVTVRDRSGHEFVTRLSNLFVIGTGGKSLVTLPRGKGVRLTILEERERRNRRK